MNSQTTPRTVEQWLQYFGIGSWVTAEDIAQIFRDGAAAQRDVIAGLAHVRAEGLDREIRETPLTTPPRT